MPSAALIVVSDAALRDASENRAAPLLARVLADRHIASTTILIPQDPASVRAAIDAAMQDADLIITFGDSGMRPSDCVVDVTRAYGLIEVPGIAEEIRRLGAQKTPAALLSRGLAGVVETSSRRVFVLNAPSSRGGAKDVAQVLDSVLDDLLRDLAGAQRA